MLTQFAGGGSLVVRLGQRHLWWRQPAFRTRCDSISATKQHILQAMGLLRKRRWWRRPGVARAERRDREMLLERRQGTAQTLGAVLVLLSLPSPQQLS